MKNENATNLTKCTYVKVYKYQDCFHDDKQDKDIMFDAYYVTTEDDFYRLPNSDFKDTVLLPFIVQFVDFFEERDPVTGQIFTYFKLYREKQIRLDKEGSPILDKLGRPSKVNLFYVIINGKKAYIPNYLLKYKSSDGSKSRDLETPFLGADKFQEDIFFNTSSELPN